MVLHAMGGGSSKGNIRDKGYGIWVTAFENTNAPSITNSTGWAHKAYMLGGDVSVPYQGFYESGSKFRMTFRKSNSYSIQVNGLWIGEAAGSPLYNYASLPPTPITLGGSGSWTIDRFGADEVVSDEINFAIDKNTNYIVGICIQQYITLFPPTGGQDYCFEHYRSYYGGGNCLSGYGNGNTGSWGTYPGTYSPLFSKVEVFQRL